MHKKLRKDHWDLMYEDVSMYGLESEYWDDVAGQTLWANDSAETQMYVAGSIYGFYHDELLRLITQKSKELLTEFDEAGFFYWKDFFAERRARRPEIKPESEKEMDVFRNGKFSEYWEEFTRDLPWESDSSEAKLYVIAKLYGYSHSAILNIIDEEKGDRPRLRDIGFFYWRDYLEEIREKEVESEEVNEETDVLQIPYDRFKRVVVYDNRHNNSYPELFLPNGDLDEDFLKAIHFNVTRSMASARMSRDSVDGFIRGCLIGCIHTGVEEVKDSNRNLGHR